MIWFMAITDVLKLMTLLICINCLAGNKITGQEGKVKGFQLLLVLVCIVTKSFLEPIPYIYFFSELLIVIVYTKIQFKKSWVLIFSYTLGMKLVLDIVNMIAAACAFPFIMVLGVKKHTLKAEIIIFLFLLFWNVLTVFLIYKMQWQISKSTSKAAQLGRILICITLELVFFYLKQIQYDSENIVIYQILLFAIGFGSVILILWILDKKEEEQKMRELISYTHKTREVIPTVGRALNRLEELSEHMDKSSEIIEELKSICNQDIKDREKEIAALKTFDTTGSHILDEQLKGYLEEAEEQEFCLDIIVRAPVSDILETKKIGRYQLLQLLGDLYRNANKIIAKKEDGGRILICFGYNMEGFYEISIHDNGEPFPKYIIEHLGKRGTTTDGTGHGLADVLQALKQSGGSFVLNQDLEESSIFTKGIRIVFDGKERLDINVR